MYFRFSIPISTSTRRWTHWPNRSNVIRMTCKKGLFPTTSQARPIVCGTSTRVKRSTPRTRQCSTLPVACLVCLTE